MIALKNGTSEFHTSKLLVQLLLERRAVYFFVTILYVVCENKTVKPSSTPINVNFQSVNHYINISHSHMNVNSRGRGPCKMHQI